MLLGIDQSVVTTLPARSGYRAWNSNILHVPPIIILCIDEENNHGRIRV